MIAVIRAAPFWVKFRARCPCRAVVCTCVCTEQLPDPGQAVAQGQRPRNIRVAEIKYQRRRDLLKSAHFSFEIEKSHISSEGWVRKNNILGKATALVVPAFAHGGDVSSRGRASRIFR